MKTFLTSLLLFLAIDFLWLAFIANRFYLSQFGEMARLKDGRFDIVYWAAAGVYLLLACAITLFVIPLAQGRPLSALGYGAFLGLLVYGVYDLTNHATLRHWPIGLMAVDVAWGTILCGIVALAVVWVSRIWA